MERLKLLLLFVCKICALTVVAAQNGSGDLDAANWMRQLKSRNPEAVKRPLNRLVIPGSHDAFAYSLNTSLPLANDGTEQAFGPFAFLLGEEQLMQIVYDWSITQTWTLSQQLEAGVRLGIGCKSYHETCYLDLRITYPRGARAVSDIRVAHGLYGQRLYSLLVDVDHWLTMHPHEVVLLHFQAHMLQHTYNMNRLAHLAVFRMMDSILGNKLCERQSARTFSLEKAWDNRCQVVSIYGARSAPLPRRQWSGGSVHNPWPNTDNISLVLQHASHALNARHMHSFFVTQTIITVKTENLLNNLDANLLEIGRLMTQSTMEWLDELELAESQKLNIVMVDAVDEPGFIDTVLRRNFPKQMS